MAREMTLTPELVALSLRSEPELAPEPGLTLLSDEELDTLARRYDAECGPDPLWVFAYGSLIWKPDFDATAHQRASAFGWHRSFCLIMRAWRGTPQQPGLMMALEHGGRCDGVIYRIAEEERWKQIRRMLFRELRFRENAHMIRWITVETETGKKRVMTFWAGPKGSNTTRKLPLYEVAHILARACGHAGSCAEYLYNTVRHLEDFGIHDRNLWTLQHRVAEELQSIHSRAVAAA